MLSVKEATDRARRLARWRAAERYLSKLDKRLEGELARFFRRQGRRFLELFALRGKLHFREAIGPELDWIWEQLRDEDLEELVRIFQLPADAYAYGASAVMAVDFTLLRPQALEWARGHAAELVGKVDDVTRQAINRIIVRGLEEGKSYQRLTKELREAFDDFSRKRAHMIAVTENRFAYQNGTIDAVRGYGQELGLMMEKEWSTTSDDAVCEECYANEAEGWLAVDEVFQSGDDTPPAHPLCRCALVYRIAGTEEEL